MNLQAETEEIFWICLLTMRELFWKSMKSCSLIELRQMRAMVSHSRWLLTVDQASMARMPSKHSEEASTTSLEQSLKQTTNSWACWLHCQTMKLVVTLPKVSHKSFLTYQILWEPTNLVIMEPYLIILVLRERDRPTPANPPVDWRSGRTPVLLMGPSATTITLEAWLESKLRILVYIDMTVQIP